MPSDNAKILSLLFGIGRRIRDEKQKYSMLHFQTLRYIKERKQPLMHDVAEYLCVTPPAATLLIEGLVKDKLVNRAFDKKDHRAVRLALTRKGNEFLSSAIKKRMNAIGKLFAVLTKKERAQFIVTLKKISGAADGGI